jgi:hypothetical protein
MTEAEYSSFAIPKALHHYTRVHMNFSSFETKASEV